MLLQGILDGVTVSSGGRLTGTLFTRLRLSCNFQRVLNCLIADRSTVCLRYSAEKALRDTLSQFESAFLSKSLSRLIDPINLVFSSSSANPPTDEEIDGIVRVMNRCDVLCTVHLR
jgi:hypothetical protein